MVDSLTIGWSKDESLRTGGPVEIPVSSLTRHVCILGATGSGKSTTATVIARALAVRGISTVILDRTGEYEGSLGEEVSPKVYKPGANLTMALFQYDNTSSLALQVEGWLGMLNHYVTVTFGSQISPLQSRLLREVFTRYYNGTHEALTISRLIAKLEAYEERFRQRGGWEESIEALVSRLVPLTIDIVGRTFDLPYSTFDLNSLFAGSISIIDMSVLEEDSGKNLLSQVILKQLYQAMRTREITEDVNLVLILDEAHHLAPNRDYFSIPERCATELRKYGFSLVVIASRPSMVSPNILANTSTIISHVLMNEHDIDSVVSYLMDGSENLAMKRAIRTLSTGSAVVQRNFPIPNRPLVCSIGHFDRSFATRPIDGGPLVRLDRPSAALSAGPQQEPTRQARR